LSNLGCRCRRDIRKTKTPDDEAEVAISLRVILVHNLAIDHLRTKRMVEEAGAEAVVAAEIKVETENAIPTEMYARTTYKARGKMMNQRKTKFLTEEVKHGKARERKHATCVYRQFNVKGKASKRSSLRFRLRLQRAFQMK